MHSKTIFTKCSIFKGNGMNMAWCMINLQLILLDQALLVHVLESFTKGDYAWHQGDNSWQLHGCAFFSWLFIWIWSFVISFSHHFPIVSNWNNERIDLIENCLLWYWNIFYLTKTCFCFWPKKESLKQYTNNDDSFFMNYIDNEKV